MAIKHLVPAIKQPNEAACFLTCLVMLDRHRSQARGVSHNVSELEDMLFSRKQPKIKPAAYLYLTGKIKTLSELDRHEPRLKRQEERLGGAPNLGQARALVGSYGFAMSKVEAKPSSFEGVLKSSGPFIYGGLSPGASVGHTVVVTGIDHKETGGTKLEYVLYNDPWDGKQNAEKEFFAFVGWISPVLKVLGSESYEVFHLHRRSKASR